MEDDVYSYSERISDWYAQIENDLVMELAESDPKYKALREQIAQIKKAHLVLSNLTGSKGPIVLSEQEHELLKELYQLNMRAEDVEREKIYFQGHADAIRYLLTVGLLKAE